MPRFIYLDPILPYFELLTEHRPTQHSCRPYRMSNARIRKLADEHEKCYFQLSPGDSPESQIPPEKHPKIQKKHLKMHWIYPPDMCFPLPEPGVQN